MDEMRIKLSTKLMRNLASKLLSKIIYQKLGYKVHIQLNDLDAHMVDGKVSVKINAEANLSSSEFSKLLADIRNK